MKTLNSPSSITLSSMNSIVLGLSFTSFNFVQVKSESLFNKNAFVSFDTISSMAVSSIFLGGLLFNLLNSIKNEKKLILFSSICNLIGYMIISIYPSIYIILFSRTLIGIASGCTCFVVPQYIYTLAPEDSKGLWTSLHPINITLGILLGQILIRFNTLEGWIIPYRCIVVSLCIISLLQIIIVETKKESEESTSITDLIKHKRSLKSLIIVSVLHVSQHISGVDYLSIYLPDILENKYKMIISVYSLSIPSVVISSFLLNKYGRKYLYITSAGLCSISTLLMIKYKVVGLILFLLGYNIGLSNVPWIIPNECTPDNYVAPITKLGIISNWGSAYLILIIMNGVHRVFGDIAYITYTILMGFMVLFSLFYVPETKGNKDWLN